MTWIPKRTLAETEAILTAPGNPHEMEKLLIDGKIHRVYKKLWPSLRAFWLWASVEYARKTYIVFEERRLSYSQVSEEAAKLACVFRDVYGIRKGDRVGICSKNSPEFLVAFWACHLIGAVSVLANAWLTLDALQFCLTHTGCRLIIIDPERADKLVPVISKLSQDAGTVGFLVMNNCDDNKNWHCMDLYSSVMDSHRGTDGILHQDVAILPEDNATIIFTSGTTGLPKGVLSTQRMFLTNVLNASVGSRRAILRRGESIPQISDGPQKGVLVAVPLFHVTGSTSFSMVATSTGMKIILMSKWIPEEGARLIKAENVSVAGGVPAMVADLTDSSVAGYPLETLLFGGCPAPDSLSTRAKKAFPTAIMSQAYGLTETNSIAVAVAADDYYERPTTAGLPCPVNDVIIMKDNVCLPVGQVGEVWLRGPNIMKQYWRDPEATNRTITRDGWLKSGDLGMLDEEGFLYIRDRLKDIIIRGGENIDSVSVENVLYSDERIAEAAAVGVPDHRLGELVAAIVTVKPAFRGLVTEESLISLAQQRLPKFAVPVMIVIQNEPLEHTPSEKIKKGPLREIAKTEWKRRSELGGKEPLARL